MKTTKETFRETIERFRKETLLNTEEITAYAETFTRLWRLQRKAFDMKLYRFREDLSKNIEKATLETTFGTTLETTFETTQGKEERITKENLSPTPPIREKNKKEETLTSVSVPRASTHTQIPSLDEMLAESAAVNVPEWYIRYWHREMASRAWASKDGSLINNWRVNLCSWYKNARDMELSSAKEFAASQVKATQEKDWTLCLERCANCSATGCTVGIQTPPACSSHPRPPEECRKFIRGGKEVR